MSGRKDTKIRFLGTGSARPSLGNDTISLVINEHILVDTGWNVVSNLKTFDIDPQQIEYLFFTHLHHDHYLSLPALLFELLGRGKRLDELKIVGPHEDVKLVVRLALQFLQMDRFYLDRTEPTVIPIVPGKSFEGKDFVIETCSTLHPVQGLCYKFHDQATGKTFSYTGDTAYHPPLADHIRGSSVLITEASAGPGKADPKQNSYLHSGAVDAAQLAHISGVEQLYLVHGPDHLAEASVEAAKQHFHGHVEWPSFGQEIIVS